MTRKIAALVAAAALGLSACASPEGPGGAEVADTSTATQSAIQAPESATVEPAAETAAPSLSQDDLAEMAYMATVGEYTYPSREEAVMVGRMACALLDNGTTAQELALEVLVADGPVVPGFLNDELPNFYGAAIGTFCQEHGWQIGVTF